MRYKQLDLNLLVALNALLIEKNISRAAIRINLSQPAMSNALSRLREYFGDELLIPLGRRMTLTARAEDLVQPVKQILMQIDSDITEAPVFEPQKSTRQFTVLASDYSLEILMPALLRKIYTSAKEVRIQVVPQTGLPHQAIENGEGDLLIIPEQYVSTDHPYLPLFEDEFVVVGWDKHPALKNKRQISIDDYVKHGHVAASFGSKSVQNLPVVEGWFLDKLNLQRRVDITVPSIAAVPSLVVGTERLATVHKRLALKVRKSLPIKIWQPPLKTPKFVQMLQWNRFREKDPGLTWLREIVLEVGRGI